MSSHREIREKLKRIEFNLTEPEVLSQLAEKAIKMGEKFRKKTETDSKNCEEIIKKLEEVGLTQGFEDTSIPPKAHEYFNSLEEIHGLDGSVQIIGSDNREFFFLFSAADIAIHPNNPSQILRKNIVADVEQKFIDLERSPILESTVFMLGCETKLLNNLLKTPNKIAIVLDGPIVDPPQDLPSYFDSSYIDLRTNSITNHIKKGNMVLGCVKRVSDRYYINYLINDLGIKKADAFLNDYFLMTHLFTKIRYKTNNYDGFLSTNWFYLAHETSILKKYAENGVNIISFFAQREIRSKVVRIDIPLLTKPEDDIEKTEHYYQIARLLIKKYWYIGLHYPLPVFLAHHKCNIRAGTAEVLYDEIITRGGKVDPHLLIIQDLVR